VNPFFVWDGTLIINNGFGGFPTQAKSGLEWATIDVFGRPTPRFLSLLWGWLIFF
jgi:hypothetical protein